MTTKKRLSGARRRTGSGKRASSFLAAPPASSLANVDVTGANELRVYAENNGRLHGQYASIMKNVARRLKNGSYDPALAPKLWMYWVDSAAREYNREFGSNTSFNTIFSKPTREYLARELAQDAVHKAPNYL